MGVSQKKSGATAPFNPPHTGSAEAPLTFSLPDQDADKHRRSWFGLLLVFLALGLGVYVWMSEKETQEKVGPSVDVSDPRSRQRLEGVVNRHVQLTNRRMEIEKEQIKVEAFMVPKVGQFVIQKEGSDASFSQQADRNELNAARDLRREQQLSVSASDIIQTEILNNQQSTNVQVYDEEYRREYARQFIENARRNGYDVQLSSDLKVIGVRRIAPSNASGEAYR